jgi:hypothetical protein
VWHDLVSRVLPGRVRLDLSVWQRMQTSGKWTCSNWTANP